MELKIRIFYELKYVLCEFQLLQRTDCLVKSVCMPASSITAHMNFKQYIYMLLCGAKDLEMSFNVERLKLQAGVSFHTPKHCSLQRPNLHV